MPAIHINGFEMYYQAAGEGAALVFVHGGFASLDTKLRAGVPNDWTWEWDFARHFHFICYDRRGCWRSSSPGEGYDLPNQATDLEGLLDQLGTGPVHLIGSSAGGPIAVLFAATRPERVRSLVLAGTGLRLFPAGDPASALIRQQIERLERAGPHAAFEQRPAGVEVSLEALWEPEEEAARGTLGEYLARQQALAARARLLPKEERIRYYEIELLSMRAYLDVDMAAYARQVTTPTLVIQGSNDKVVPPEWAEEIARAIPAAQYYLVSAGSHSLMHRHAGARQIAREFIRRNRILPYES
jgi:3-oxoadipate enol-lactonase